MVYFYPAAAKRILSPSSRTNHPAAHFFSVIYRKYKQAKRTSQGKYVLCPGHHLFVAHRLPLEEDKSLVTCAAVANPEIAAAADGGN